VALQEHTEVTEGKEKLLIYAQNLLWSLHFLTILHWGTTIAIISQLIQFTFTRLKILTVTVTIHSKYQSE